MEVIIYSDGASRGNPGRGGYGTRIEYTSEDGRLYVKELSQGYRLTTNNRMELLGVISGLEALVKPCIVTIYSDSQYIVNAINKHWIDNWRKRGWKTSAKKNVLNRDLWERLIVAMKPHEVHFNWVKGHDGNPGNERCDTLATTAADSDTLIEDTGFHS